MADELRQFKNEIIEHFDEKTTETQRHFEVLTEHMDGKFQLLTEQVAANTEKLEEHSAILKEHSQRFDIIDVKFAGIDENLDIMKTDLEFIKNELKQKVSRDEFVFLEKRVSMIETKLNGLK